MLAMQVLDRLCRAPHLSEVVCLADDLASSEDGSCSGGLSDPLLRFSHVVRKVRRGRSKPLMELAVQCTVLCGWCCSVACAEALAVSACGTCSSQSSGTQAPGAHTLHGLTPCRLPTCVVMCGRNVLAMRSKGTPTQRAVRACAHINNMPKHFRPKP